MDVTDEKVEKAIAEGKAIQRVLQLLKPLTPNERRRVINWAYDKYVTSNSEE